MQAETVNLSIYDLKPVWEEHGVEAQRRARLVAGALLEFVDRNGRIPEQHLRQAIRLAVLRAGRSWGSKRVLLFAGRCRLLYSSPI